MSWQFMFPLLKMPLQPGPFAVAMKLADGMDERGFISIGYGAIARRNGISRRTAIAIMRELITGTDAKGQPVPAGSLLEVVHRGGLNARGYGRGGSKQTNTFRARWQRKQRQPANGAEAAPFVAETVQILSANGAENDPETVQILHPISTKNFPLGDPRKRSRARETRGAPSPSPSSSRDRSAPGDNRVAFTSGCGLDVMRWQHETFCARLVRFQQLTPDAADRTLRAGYQDAIAALETTGGVPAGKAQDFWWAWWDATYGTATVTPRSRKHAERDALKAANLATARRVAGIGGL